MTESSSVVCARISEGAVFDESFLGFCWSKWKNAKSLKDTVAQMFPLMSWWRPKSERLVIIGVRQMARNITTNKC